MTNSDAYSSGKIRIAIFDDSRGALKQFKSSFEASGKEVDIRSFTQPELEEAVRNQLIAFKPHLIVVDLLMGGSREDGYYLISQIQAVPELVPVPIVVCSKFVDDSKDGQAEKTRCLSFPGVVNAYSKIPSFPSPDELLKPQNLVGGLRP